MASHFYAPPVMPQGATPPQRKVPIPGQAGNADFVPVVSKLYILRAVFDSIEEARNEIYYRARRASIVGKLPDQSGNADKPPIKNRIHLPLEQYRWLVEPAIAPQRKLPPALFPPEPETALLFSGLRNIKARLIQQQHLDSVEQGFTAAFNIIKGRKFVRFELPFIPPGRIVAFQPNAFQSTYPGELYAYQSQDRFVTLSLLGQSTLRVKELVHIVLGPIMAEYRRGTAIVITAETYDPAQTPERLFNPGGGVMINLIAPSGILVLEDFALGRISTGRFKTIYQTSGMNEAGIYLLEAVAVNAGHEAMSAQQVAFRLNA